MKRGDLFLSSPGKRLAHQHLISVTRVARDESWADIQVRTWAVMWSKRQPLKDGKFAFDHEPYVPGRFSFRAQEDDHIRMLAERES
jgi:hypothetical protein